MKITIKIYGEENDAYRCDDNHIFLARDIHQALKTALHAGNCGEGIVSDYNGNSVGTVTVVEA